MATTVNEAGDADVGPDATIACTEARCSIRNDGPANNAANTTATTAIPAPRPACLHRIIPHDRPGQHDIQYPMRPGWQCTWQCTGLIVGDAFRPDRAARTKTACA